MADITEIKLPDATVFTVKDPNAQPKTLATPLTINGNTESTVEGALDGLNDYSDALKDNLAANENVYGAKNLNSYPYKDTTKSLNGITFTDNGNGTITVNGTASANTVFDMHLYLDNPCIVENGAYILSGCPSGGGISTYNIRAYEKNSGGTDVVIGKDYGDGVTLTLNGDYYDSNSVHLDLAIVVTAGAVISTPITFKPMLRDARVIDPTFAPFAETNLQLTRKTSGLSNENLLDNGWFTINQRGWASAVGIYNSYCVDRWKMTYGDVMGTIEASSNGLHIIPNTLGDRTTIYQPCESSVYNLLNGKVLTFSALLSDGTLYKGSNTLDTSTSNYIDFVVNEKIQLRWNGGYKSFWVDVLDEITIRAVKLELGTVSTLANDVTPDNALELAKCRASTADPSDTYANKGNLVNYADMTSIYVTGSTNTTGVTIASGTFFYLNGQFCKAIADIAANATFTLNTNYSVDTVGAEIASCSKRQYTLLKNATNTDGTVVYTLNDNISNYKELALYLRYSNQILGGTIIPTSLLGTNEEMFADIPASNDLEYARVKKLSDTTVNLWTKGTLSGSSAWLYGIN